MLEHLLDFEPPIESPDRVVPVAQVSAPELVAAQQGTVDWLASLGAPTEDSTDAQLAASLAQQAFTAVTTSTPTPDQHAALLQLKTPPAVRHLVGMLTAYDWAFVEQARELRGYAVSQILEETKNPDPRIRLRALEMLGRVTEVALFTDRVEVKKTSVNDAELDAKIKEKLSRFMAVTDVSDVSDASVVLDVSDVSAEADAS
jgi:hypothetical protein